MSKTDEMLERIACELHELNATINCRFDVFDDIVSKLSEIDASCFSTTTAIDAVWNTLRSANDKFYEDY